VAVCQRGHQSVPPVPPLVPERELTRYLDRLSGALVTIPQSGQSNATIDDADTSRFAYGGTWGVGAAASQVSHDIGAEERGEVTC
jgi:hypothetical protein